MLSVISGPDIKACLANYQRVYEKLQEKGKQLEIINAKLDKSDALIIVIRMGKSIKKVAGVSLAVN